MRVCAAGVAARSAHAVARLRLADGDTRATHARHTHMQGFAGRKRGRRPPCHVHARRTRVHPSREIDDGPNTPRLCRHRCAACRTEPGRLRQPLRRSRWRAAAVTAAA
ncbi:hypothetical protein XHV734_0965 [Xanthomonas hortorum pv. vitians]|nr:hypothetical protein XHV734_0965 [Xanthomonas hortorum pv. vitians]